MDEFWQNISRYPRFLISVILGIFFAFFQRLNPFWKRPLTAIALAGILISGGAFMFFTLKAMLGLNTI